MSKALLNQLEKAIRQRNPTLANRLQPGLSGEQVRKMLQDAEIEGGVEPIVNLFSWKNGSQFDASVRLAEVALFPESVYVFPDLKAMIEHFKMFHEGFVYHPNFDEADGRYFPLFWDNSTGYLAADLKSPTHRVVLLDPESEDLAREVYSSFEEFLKDAIRANEENDSLAFFHTQ